MRAGSGIPLSNGLSLPSIGLGTFEVTNETLINDSIRAALRAGYRLIDTAQCYRNEHIIGRVLWSACAELCIERKDIVLTSKVHPGNHGYEQTMRSIENSLADLQTDYIDLLLIHWPGTKGVPVHNVDVNRAKRLDTWRAMSAALKNGLVKSLGVSNYTVHHLEELYKWIFKQGTEAQVYPVVNQIEVHPGWYPEADIQWCRQNGVAVQGYSSLGRAKSLLENIVIVSIAEELSISAVHVCLLYSRQKNIPVLPKSTNRDHILENWRAFHSELRLTDAHMDRLAEIPQTKVCWDPRVVL
ncbi:unnamed protein product [Ectocarpus fasciculatus]